jgi:2-haloacid dehalogenase
MPRPEAVVFDIGNVLVEWHPARVYDAEIGAEARARLFGTVDLAGMNLAVDRGRPLAEAVAALAARHPGQADLIRLWQARWDEMFAPVIDGSVRLLLALRDHGVPVFALSNFGRETFVRAQARHEFLRAFDRRFISGELGTLKPEPQIYAAVEAASGIAPDRLLFVDDRPENIEAAAARGWAVQHFADPATGPAALAARLVAEGLLPAAAALPEARA